MSDCQHCTRKTELHLCTPCANVLSDLLAELPWLLYELDVTITRQDRLDTSSGSMHQLMNPSPINVGAMELARAATATLHQIALDVAQIHASERIPALVNATPIRVAIWLKSNLSAISRHERAGDHYTAIAALVGETHAGQIHAAINRSYTRFAGPCPTVRAHDQHGVAITCSTMLYAYDGAQYVICPRCEATIDIEDNRRRAAAANDLLPVEVILDVLNGLDGEHTDEQTLRSWIVSGKLPTRGYLTRNGIKPRGRSTNPRVYSLSRARQLRAQLVNSAYATTPQDHPRA